MNLEPTRRIIWIRLQKDWRYLSPERMKLSKEVLSIIQDAYGSRINIFENKIPTSVKVGEANMKSKSTIEYDSKNKVSIAYREFAKEVAAI
mgnify:CR=1 FL=1